MEELDLKEMFSYFWSKKFIIFLITSIVFIFGIIYTNFIQKPKYRSYTTILLTKESESTTITSNDIALNQKLVNTYQEIITSKKVLSRVINNLQLDCSVGELQKQIKVESVKDTEIIKIIVTDANNEKAMQIANQIATVFNSEVIKLFNIQNIGVIDKAEVSIDPYNVNIIKQLIIAFAIGAILSLGTVFIMFYFDNTVKNGEEIEKKLGVSVIGLIPAMGGKKHE